MAHYHYIEVGTSDFNTICESAKPGTVGISMDPIGYYLDCLPSRDGNIKVEAALVQMHDSEQTVYWLPPQAIVQYGLPKWLRGCNSVGAPHKTVINLLKTRRLPESLLQAQGCTCLTPNELVSKFGVDSLGVLKLDTEGMDSVLIASWLDSCETGQAPLPVVIWWECNHLSNPADVAGIVNRLSQLGFVIYYRDQYDCVMANDVQEATTLLFALGIQERRFQDRVVVDDHRE